MTDTPEIPVVDTQGQLPRFWSDDVIFFANLLELFFGNEKETRELEETVGEVDSYGGRLIPILNLVFRGGRNTLVLERHSAGALCRYFEQRLMLSLPEMKIMAPGDYRRLRGLIGEGNNGALGENLAAYRNHSASCVDGYVTDDILVGIADQLGKRTITTTDGCRRGNNKFLLHQYLEKTGLPTISTRTARSRDEVNAALANLAAEGFDDAVLKSQIGASGIGIQRVREIADFGRQRRQEIPEHLFFEGPVMVQGWLKPGHGGVTNIHSPSVQMFLDAERVWLFDLTEQILSHDSIHEGNISPPPYLAGTPGLRQELLRQAGIAGRWLHAQGYRGTASTDFLLVERDGDSEPKAYVCEINARVTGATYPSVLARHFTPNGAWLMRNLRLQTALSERELLEMLEQSGQLFAPGMTKGILPINFNFGSEDLVHKGQFLYLAPTTDECWQELELAETQLPVEWHADRD